MIKTIIEGEGLIRALARQQQWVDAHPDAWPDVDPFTSANALADERILRTHRRGLAFELEQLRAENTSLKHQVRLALCR